ncbi:hypothetical protein DHEL01_v203565 [Diaporthe helianthi]|uniref:Uncharacterized protein n=1 Tax=Diaporthe helianthi TaxID=158607 RepID=A0A2P5I6C5_DIAHE|nr:hypothetical protein DHEL01_v203565 [Diaporthe helianthi]
MDDVKAKAPGSTINLAQDDGAKAVRRTHAVLGRELGLETDDFMSNASHQLYPHTTGAAPYVLAETSLREHHFNMLMEQAIESFAEGRGQDFADERIAIHNILLQKPEHKQLAEHFCRLMGRWLQLAHNKRQQEEDEREERLVRQLVERKKRQAAEQEKGANKAEDNMKKRVGNDGRGRDRVQPDLIKNASSSLDASNQDQHEVVGDEAGTSPAKVRARSIFDLAGLGEIDES